MIEVDENVLNKIVKAYDVRGLYPEQINSEVCKALGAGYAMLVAEVEPDTKSVVIGRDMRPSGPELVEAFSQGVTEQGLDVVDVGLASTDLLYFASGSLNMPGVMFTASHNPAEYNGIKMCLSAAAPIGEGSGLEKIRESAISYMDKPVAAKSEVGKITSQDLLEAFGEHVRSFVDVNEMTPLKVIADTANGMGGHVLPEVFKSLPYDVEIMYEELDGTFPNHEANPLDFKNLEDLQARVLETGADIGLAFDGDADRVFLVDDKAQPVSGSLTTALLAQAVLETDPGATIIHNLICSKVVPEAIEENGGRVVRSRVGHSFIKQEMARTGAAFGGEHSAHYYFKDNWRADSGLIAAVLVLEQLSKSGGTLSELLAPLQRYAASGEINTKVADTGVVIEAVANHYKDCEIDRLDGLTVQNKGWWFNLRPSNTEPLLRLNLEAETDADVERFVKEVQAVMTSV